jgi:hypothetical protein
MLPHVDAEDGNLAFANHGILVFCRGNGKALLIACLNLNQPSPSAALDTQQRSIERLLEFVFIAPHSLDLLYELRSGRAFRFL